MRGQQAIRLPVEDRRDAFLLEMYRQASSHLNRHILLSWQSVGVVVGATSVIALGDKALEGARLDYVVTVVVLLCRWLIAHVFDADNWFNRNLHIIGNIERQFLKQRDAAEIHYFFLSDRLARTGKKGAVRRMIRHFQAQLFFSLAVGVLLLLYHFLNRVFPGFSLPLANFQLERALPYVAVGFCTVYCVWVAISTAADYDKLRRESPGRTI
jgi:hypothetical protein